MPTTDCSHCGRRIEAIPFDETDTMFDWRCSECGEPVVIDGNATEQQRQMDARRRLTRQIQDFAAELETPNYQPTPFSAGELKERLEDILADVDQELDRRQSE